MEPTGKFKVQEARTRRPRTCVGRVEHMWRKTGVASRRPKDRPDNRQDTPRSCKDAAKTWGADYCGHANVCVAHVENSQVGELTISTDRLSLSLRTRSFAESHQPLPSKYE
ncbi:unnamed protein product [Ectocarpus sp. 13 AM-2016]